MVNQSDPLNFRFELTGGLSGTLVKEISGSDEATFSWSELEDYFGVGDVPLTFSGNVAGRNNLIGLGFARPFEDI